MLFRSVGLTWGTFCSNEATLTRGMTITVPAMVAGSSWPMSLASARIEVYSVPCAPDTSASTGPGRAPWITATALGWPEATPGGATARVRGQRPELALGDLHDQGAAQTGDLLGAGRRQRRQPDAEGAGKAGE